VSITSLPRSLSVAYRCHKAAGTLSVRHSVRLSDCQIVGELDSRTDWLTNCWAAVGLATACCTAVGPSLTNLRLARQLLAMRLKLQLRQCLLTCLQVVRGGDGGRVGEWGVVWHWADLLWPVCQRVARVLKIVEIPAISE